MNQIHSHSQTPSFNKVRSQTTAILRQHPTVTNTVSYKSKSGLVLPAIITIIVCAGGLFSCTAHETVVSKIGGK